MPRKGIYRVSDGRFLERLWPTQPQPQVEAGEVVVRPIPSDWKDVLSHTRWDGSSVVPDMARITETAQKKAEIAAALAKEEADARAAWDILAVPLTAEQKAVLGVRLGFKEADDGG